MVPKSHREISDSQIIMNKLHGQISSRPRTTDFPQKVAGGYFRKILRLTVFGRYEFEVQKAFLGDMQLKHPMQIPEGFYNIYIYINYHISCYLLQVVFLQEGPSYEL